ncbi:unnamed protein product [Penicillium olsonii]|uniref:mRNA export factor GLE1 n=1 Tax=Penicillium olsonii TaxID=99116 RepID=A0A9W4IAB7_PENOL|nr:unnamed protein product [Penicillium olsonii]CAG8029034.1 unnamed protein product [Penicillium olsonii]CAG8249602.1 unnamed protein product [Penicillium olsonii]
MTRHRSHGPPLIDSPSKQLMLDLVRDLEQVRLFDEDLKKVHAYERKSYYENLDRVDREREAIHTAALDEVEAIRTRVQEEAVTTLNDHIRAEEEERLRKEAIARKEKERIEREKAEKERIEREAAARAEAERKAKEEAAQKAKKEAEAKAAEAERTRQAALDEKARKEREQAEAAKRKEIEDAQKAKQEAEELAQSKQQQNVGAGILSPEDIQTQQRYVELHKTLKEMRKWLTGMAKGEPALKKAMGDMRRSIKKSVGQLRSGTGANKNQINQIKADLQNALAFSQPTVDIAKFIAFPPQELTTTENKAPAMLIYGLNVFSKSLISSLLAEAAIKQSHAEPIGIIAAQIFSLDIFTYKGLHMSDILWAKYRVVCPALWGFTGNDKTEGGRRTLGWWREPDTGSWISEQNHMDRMTALGAGYAAITLRNFGKTTRQNPFPNTLFWATMSKIMAIPAAQLQETQIALLAALLRSSGERIMGFFGQYGLALMHHAIVELPRQIERESMALTQLSTLKELYMREKNILI